MYFIFNQKVSERDKPSEFIIKKQKKFSELHSNKNILNFYIFSNYQTVQQLSAIISSFQKRDFRTAKQFIFYNVGLSNNSPIKVKANNNHLHSVPCDIPAMSLTNFYKAFWE